ncbi:unnamed protein product [Danaus chrysippus]|uniref:mRNA export factor GLE1 n=1 Tax=Danaus chrysippus TaxID=151541 RepID=A0A8J2VTZ4_9NEOP|nr:unnamed protein product [Danaus chrysippus]
MEDSSFNSYDLSDLSRSIYKNGSINLSITADFEKMRISALTRAAEISPHVTEVTIGPKSPKKKEKSKVNQDLVPDSKEMFNLLEDKLGEDLRYTLILKKYENELKETSENLVKNLIENMVTTYSETMKKYVKKHNEECKRKLLELRAKKLQMAKLLRDNDNVLVLEKAKLDEKQCEMINQQTLDNMNRVLEEQKKAAIVDSHLKIGIHYNDISNLANSEPLANEILEKYIHSINSVIANINSLMTLCKTGPVTDKEVKQSEILAANLENLKNKFVNEVEKTKEEVMIKKQKEQELLLEKQKEEEAKRKQLEEKRAQELKAAEEAKIQQALLDQSKRAQSMFYSEKNYAHYTELRDFLDKYENSYKDLLQDNNCKKFRFDCQKAVNTPVNALSSVSGVHMRDKFDKLSKLLRGERVQVLDTFVTATQHPQGLPYCTALLAKKIVRQGDLLVSSNPDAAFPLAAVTVALWSQFPEFGKLLEAYFHRFCPYLVPMLLPQKEGQTDKEFYISRGYTYNDEGVVEKQDKFLRRMSGIFRLRCAMWITSTPRFLNVSNPNGMGFSWRWLASFINLKPEPDISATLLHDFFIVCGSKFLKLYGKQCVKIIKLLSTEYLSILQNIDEGGPKTRLEVFLQNVIKSGHIEPPSGILPPNIW